MKRLCVTMMLAAEMLLCTLAVAQNAYQLFGPVDTRPSTYTTPTAFGTQTVNLTCPAGVPITAIISSSPTMTGSDTCGYANVFTDNYIGLTVNSCGRVNICRNGYLSAPEGGTNCFNTAYTTAYTGLNGQDPDTFVATYGVPALDISADLFPGANEAKFELLDFGVSLGASSVWLITNCTQNGIAPGGSQTGNPISATSPTPSQLTQPFLFDSTTGQRVEFTADYSVAAGSQTLTIVDGTTPTVSNQGLSPLLWPAIVNGTSFATTTCVPDLGLLDPSGNPLCTVSLIQCTNSMNSTPAGDNCPQSTARNIQMFHVFDAAPASVTNLPQGSGLGFLEGSDSWPGSSCVFVGPETGVMCPQNPITSFLGDERSGSPVSTTNSAFVVVAGVPLASTLAGFTPDSSGWSNNSSVTLNFLTTPPVVAPPNNNFVAAPIHTMTYGIDSGAPYPDTSLPIPGDVTLPKTNPVTCPGVPTPGALPLATTDTVTLAEGSHLLHYFSTDCAGTEELVFTPNISNPGSWTSFKTMTINVDTTLPFVATGPTLTPAGPYQLNKAGVVASYSCTDPAGSGGATPSGVTVCGPTGSAPVGPTPSTGTLTSGVNTSVPGTHTFTVNVQDLAGNVGTPASATYIVDFNYKGFYLPVLNPPFVNFALAGWVIPFRFSLGGNQGLAIMAPGYPISEQIACWSGRAITPVNETTSGDSSLTYNPVTGLYIYAWKTDPAWRNTCREFVMKLTDNTTHVADFWFP